MTLTEHRAGNRARNRQLTAENRDLRALVHHIKVQAQAELDAVEVDGGFRYIVDLINEAVVVSPTKELHS